MNQPGRKYKKAVKKAQAALAPGPSDIPYKHEQKVVQAAPVVMEAVSVDLKNDPQGWIKTTWQ